MFAHKSASPNVNSPALQTKERDTHPGVGRLRRRSRLLFGERRLPTVRSRRRRTSDRPPSPFDLRTPFRRRLVVPGGVFRSVLRLGPAGKAFRSGPPARVQTLSFARFPFAIWLDAVRLEPSVLE